MELSKTSHSSSFFDVSNDVRSIQFHSWEGRMACLRDFLKKFLVLPLSLLYKIYRTGLRGSAVVLGSLFLLITLGSSTHARAFFVDRVSILARDLADWVIYPFAILSSLVKIIFGFLASILVAKTSQ